MTRPLLPSRWGPVCGGWGGRGRPFGGARESWAELSSREAALGSPCTYRRVPGASQLPPGPSVAGGPGGAWGEGLSKRPLDRCTLGSPGDFFCLFYLFIYLFWLCRDLVTARGIFHWRHVGFSLVVARGLSCPVARRILVPRTGMEPTSPELEGGFLTTGPPGKPLPWRF